MSEREQIDEILYDFFFGILEDINKDKVPLIFEGENGVRPVSPFLSIGYGSITALGTIPYFKPRMNTVENNDEKKYFETTAQPVERICTLRGFGESTEELLNTIRDYLQFDKYVNVLAKKNVTIKNMDTVTEGSSNLSEDEETFYFCDFVVTYNRITQLENEYIGGVSISSDGLEKPDMESKTSPVNIEIQEE